MAIAGAMAAASFGIVIAAGVALRVGYNPDSMPFSYRNGRGEIVGFDISFAYELAHSLDVKLELVPFEWGRLARDLIDRRSHVAMSGIYETEDRLQMFAVSHIYYQSPVASIVSADRAQIMAMPNLRAWRDQGRT